MSHAFARRVKTVWSRICKDVRLKSPVTDLQEAGWRMTGRGYARGVKEIARRDGALTSCGQPGAQEGGGPLRIPRRAGGNGTGEGESTYRQIADVAIKKADQYREGEINSLIIDSDSETLHLMARFRKPH